MILVFLTGIAFEVLYTCWINDLVTKQALRAALWSISIGALSLYGVGSVVRDPSMAPALLLGYGVGTFGTVKWLSR